jgi:hypothetical protein
MLLGGSVGKSVGKLSEPGFSGLEDWQDWGDVYKCWRRMSRGRAATERG